MRLRPVQCGLQRGGHPAITARRSRCQRPELSDPAAPTQLTFAKHCHVISNLCQAVGDVGRSDHSKRRRCQLLQQTHGRLTRSQVQPSGGFIEDDQVGLRCKATCHGEAMQLSTREVGRSFRSVGFEPDESQRRFGIRMKLFRRNAPEPGHILGLFSNGEPTNCRTSLRNQRDSDVAGPGCGNRANRSVLRFQPTGGQTEQS